MPVHVELVVKEEFKEMQVIPLQLPLPLQLVVLELSIVAVEVAAVAMLIELHVMGLNQEIMEVQEWW
tara:strand:+ start:612 stop:812 length:201 start_codon:yes stop_codon:yes gene_type:complete